MAESASFDDADYIIFRVYEWKFCRESYEQLCEMPFDAFCKLYERANLHDAYFIEAKNEEMTRARMQKEQRRKGAR